MKKPEIIEKYRALEDLNSRARTLERNIEHLRKIRLTAGKSENCSIVFNSNADRYPLPLLPDTIGLKNFVAIVSCSTILLECELNCIYREMEIKLQGNGASDN